MYTTPQAPQQAVPPAPTTNGEAEPWAAPLNQWAKGARTGRSTSCLLRPRACVVQAGLTSPKSGFLEPPWARMRLGQAEPSGQ